MDMEELWSKTREVLRAEVNAVVYNSLLGSNNLVPALLDGDTLVLRVVMDNLKLLITNQWYSTIVRALSQVAGHQMDVEILTQEEIEAACRMASVKGCTLHTPPMLTESRSSGWLGTRAACTAFCTRRMTLSTPSGQFWGISSRNSSPP